MIFASYGETPLLLIAFVTMQENWNINEEFICNTLFLNLLTERNVHDD